MKFFSFYLQKIPDVNFIVHVYIDRIIFFQSPFNIEHKSIKTFKKMKVINYNKNNSYYTDRLLFSLSLSIKIIFLRITINAKKLFDNVLNLWSSHWRRKWLGTDCCRIGVKESQVHILDFYVCFWPCWHIHWFFYAFGATSRLRRKIRENKYNLDCLLLF